MFVVFGVVTLLVAVTVLVVVSDAVGSASERPAWRAAVPTLVRTPRWLLLALGGFGALWGTWGTTTWMQNLMVLGHGLSPSRAGLVVSAFGLGAVVAKPIIGAVCDRLGPARVVPMVVILALFTAGLVGFGFLTTPGAFLAAAPLLGVVAFGYSPLMNSMVTEVGPGDVGRGGGRAGQRGVAGRERARPARGRGGVRRERRVVPGGVRDARGRAAGRGAVVLAVAAAGSFSAASPSGLSRRRRQP